MIDTLSHLFVFGSILTSMSSSSQLDVLFHIGDPFTPRLHVVDLYLSLVDPFNCIGVETHMNQCNHCTNIPGTGPLVLDDVSSQVVPHWIIGMGSHSNAPNEE